MTETRYTLTDYLEIPRSINPSFSPSGNVIAYLNNQSGTYQLCTMHSDGSNQRTLTSFPEPVEGVSFSPVSDDILFIRSTGGNEEHHLFLRKENSEIIPITTSTNAKHVGGQWSHDGKKIAYASTVRNKVDFDIFVVDVKSGEAQPVFAEGGNCYPLSFSPDGNYLGVYRHNHISDKELFLVDLVSGQSQTILPSPGDEKAHFGSMKWAADSSGFYYLTNQGTNFVRLRFYSIATHQSKDILSFDWDITKIALTQDGTKMALTINEEGYSLLRIYETKNWTKLYELPLRGEIENYSWDPQGNQLAIVFNNAQNPPNIWIHRMSEKEVLPLTTSPSKIALSSFVEPILEHYFSFDDMSIPIFVYYPQSTESKAPVIVNIHGGPSDQEGPGFRGLNQYFVQRGYAVIAPNIRGSSGYGKQYLASDDGRKRMDSIKDLQFLHAFIRENPRLDASRTALLGGSYGGYMVLAGLAFQPECWSAGVDIVGISNLVTFLKNTSPYRRKIREAEYGSLETDIDFMESISPSNYIQNIRAPLLVIHGANDPRVPLSEAENIVEKLHKKGNHVELKVYPDEGHGLAKLKNRIDAYSRVVDFLDEQLQKGLNQ